MSQESQILAYEHAANPLAAQSSDIYVADTNGTKTQALTHDHHSHKPVWSPDGKQVLFIRVPDWSVAWDSKHNRPLSLPPSELYVINSDGTHLHLLKKFQGPLLSAVWSPDGKTLAVRLAFLNRMQSGLWLVPAHGAGDPQLLFRNAYTPAWSHDGRKLAFSAEISAGRWAVHVANGDGSNEVQLTDPVISAGSPVWSPDDKLIAFEALTEHGRGTSQIFLMNNTGSNVRQLTDDSERECEHPSWSADGRQIAFFCRSRGCGPIGGQLRSFSACTRRIFVLPLNEPEAKPREVIDQDGAFPSFHP